MLRFFLYRFLKMGTKLHSDKQVYGLACFDLKKFFSRIPALAFYFSLAHSNLYFPVLHSLNIIFLTYSQ